MIGRKVAITKLCMTGNTADENETRYGNHVLHKVVTIVYDFLNGLYLTDYFVPEYINEKNDFVHYGFIIVNRYMIEVI